MKYQIEKPSTQDLFGSKGHENTAFAIKDTIENHSNIHLIGLEGELGAGKSTVLNLLKSQLDTNKYKFIEFDVEKYHHSSTKSSLIKVVSTELNKLYGNDREISKKINEAKNLALGNTFSYEKNVNSKIHWITLLFVISLLMMVRTLQPALNYFFEKDNTQWFNLEHLLSLSLGFSPLIIAAFLILAPKITKFTWVPKFLTNLIKNLPPVGNALKRNSTDTISETLLVNKEVSSIELENAFTQFIQTIPQNEVIILIVDNLDRVDSKKVKEIWSDLEVFTSLSTENSLTIIVPYSGSHISIALSSDKDKSEDSTKSGQEFISKRMPVIFRAPPIVSAGWREPFSTFWLETLIKNKGKDATSDLIDLWSSTLESGQVTPRFLKKHINDIATTLLSNTISSPAPESCSAYILICRINNIPVTTFLSSIIDDNHQFRNKLEATKRILRRYVGNDNWITEIMSIHYQTDKDIAKAELLIEPMKSAINQYDDYEILSLSNIYGFDVEFRKYIRTVESYDLVRLLDLIIYHRDYENKDEDDKKSRTAWAESWLEDINFSLLESKNDTHIDNYDEDLISSFNNLISSGIDINTIRIENEMEHSLKSLPIYFEQDDKEQLNLTNVIYNYSSIVNKIPKRVSDYNDDFFSYVLWPNRNKFPKWDIVKNLKSNNNSTIKFIDDNQMHFDMLDYFKEISKFKQITNDDIYKIKTTTLELLDFTGDLAYILPYTSDWYNKNEIQGIVYDLIEKVNLNEDDNYWLSILLAYTVENNAFSSQFKITRNSNRQQIISEYITEKFDYENKDNELLLKLFSYSTSSTKIINAYSDENLKPLIRDIVLDLIDNSKIYSLNINDCYIEKYDLYKEIINNPLDHLAWLSVWLPHGLKQFEEWHPDLIEDILNCNQNKFLDSVWGLLNETHNTEYWNNIINNVSNEHKFIYYFNEKNKTLKKPSIIADAIIIYLEGIEEESEISNIITPLISMLPKPSTNRVINNVNRLMLDRTLPIDKKILLINTFGNDIKVQNQNKENVQDQILLIAEKINNQLTSGWLTN
ncbi:P-loop NTPase fold protein, partial [Aliivibrio sifiae]